MQALDWLVVLAYFMVILGLAWWVFKRGKDTADDYFLANRNLGWFIVGASIFASNIGSEHLVGLAGSGATSGVALAHYELHAWAILVLGWLFVPFYMRSRVFTMPEFLERRFSPSSRVILSITSLLTHVLTKFAVSIFAGGVVFRALLPELHVTLLGHDWNAFWIGSVLIVLLTGVYTVLGGMRAVAYTEAMQTFVLVFGSALLTIFGLIKIGGWHAFRSALDPDLFNLWKPLIPHGLASTWAPVKEAGRQAWYFNTNYPWLGMLFCAPIIGLWYWCTDQYIVQRALGAPDEKTARRGSIFASYIKLLPVFIFIIPGMISFALARSGKIAALATMVGPDGKAIPMIAQSAYPMLVMSVLPVGIRGIVVAGLIAALMSSMAGAFNASSTLFTMDLYQKLRPNSSQHELVWMGRVATAVMVLVALLWIPVIEGARGLYEYLQSVQGYLAPPIFTVFFFGIFNKRLNTKGCISALVVGFLLGTFRLLVDTPVALHLAGYENGYTQGSFLWVVNNIYFQYYSLLVFVVSVVVMVGVSYSTAAPATERLTGLTFATITDEHRQESRSSWDWRDVFASALVVVLIVCVYLYFRG
ncbi:MAG TPA: sodium:solute symporter [Gemmatimonadales bacterium]|nr:sodium:solute symporter [Gemmatimonadales bacterium]